MLTFVDFKMPEKYNGCAVADMLKEKLSRTRNSFRAKFEEFFKRGIQRDAILEGLSEALILADVGWETSEKIIRSLKEKTRKDDTPAEIETFLKEELIALLARYPSGLSFNSSPSVVMFVGVNGGGKTTSLAKLACDFRDRGRNVLMVAADTFRAAAQEQLSLWGKKLGIPVVRGQYGADPASVIYDAIQSFKAREFNLLLVDTAGRIHTNANLMNELEKIKRVVAREIEGGPHEILLVLDSTIGQNALLQAREFLKFSGITGIFLTKLDGTAKGGSVLSIVDELKLPVKLIGIGESEKDMLRFSPREFVEALLS